MLVRATGAGFAVYLARRSTQSRFMPGVYVFPGGAVDAADRDEAAFERIFGTVQDITEHKRTEQARAPDPGPVSIHTVVERAGRSLSTSTSSHCFPKTIYTSTCAN